MSSRALAAAKAVGLPLRVIRPGPVGSLAEAARVRGAPPADVVKTLVVRRGAGEHGVALAASADKILQVLDATVADISDPESAS